MTTEALAGIWTTEDVNKLRHSVVTKTDWQGGSSGRGAFGAATKSCFHTPQGPGKDKL